MQSRIFKVTALVLLLVLWTTLSLLATESEAAQRAVAELGYVGIFIIAAVSGFNLLVPIPVVVFFPLFLSAGLDFSATVVAVSIGMTAGDAIGFIIGKTFRGIVMEHPHAKHPIVELFDRLVARYPKAPYVVLACFVSVIPVPNEVLVIPMAFVGYKFRYMLPALIVGNIIFNTVVALGIIGLDQVV